MPPFKKVDLKGKFRVNKYTYGRKTATKLRKMIPNMYNVIEVLMYITKQW
jgi:hypothetical protein